MLCSRWTASLFILLLFSLAGGAAFATPSGLNNIPTADVAPENVLVLQAFSQFGDGLQPNWFAGFKCGPAKNWEVGIDDRVSGPGPSSNPALQLKYRFELDSATAIAAGGANITTDTERNGNAFPYLVVSHDFKTLRGHLGYSFEKDNPALFVGADKAVSKDLTLRADWIQVQDGQESLSSIGFLNRLNAHLLVEGWASFPSAQGADTNYVLKVDYVIPMK